MHQVLELGKLHLLPERPLFGEAVQELRHPPREALGLPHAREGAGGVAVELFRRILLVEGNKSLRKIKNIARGEVEALGAGRRDDVPGIAGEEEPSEAKRLGDEAAKRRNALLDRRPGDELAHRALVEAPQQLLPEALVGPLVELLG